MFRSSSDAPVREIHANNANDGAIGAGIQRGIVPRRSSVSNPTWIPSHRCLCYSHSMYRFSTTDANYEHMSAEFALRNGRTHPTRRRPLRFGAQYWAACEELPNGCLLPVIIIIVAISNSI